MKKILFSALGIAALALSSANFAKADIITEWTGTVAGVYSYNVILTGGEELLGGTAGQFGTLYNVDGTLGNITGDLASLFSFSTGTGTIAPANQQPTIVEEPGNGYIRFTFNGASTVTGGDNTIQLGTFTVTAAANAFSSVDTYDGNAYLSTLGTLNGNRGNAVAPSAVPEPVSMSLLGGGLALLGLVRLRRK